MDQFNAGQVWSVVAGMMNDIVGGHDVPIVGHPGGGYWTCITWGQRQVMTYAFLQATCDEMWTYIDPERYPLSLARITRDMRTQTSRPTSLSLPSRRMAK